MREKMPSRFKMPQLDPYDGTTDPVDHLTSFRSLMILQGAPDAIMCKAFPATLRKAARHWFYELKPGSIGSFEQLSRLFTTHFASSKIVRRGSDALLNIKQREGESLREYLTRFNAAVLEVRNLDPSIAMSALKGGLQVGSLLFSLEKRFPSDFPEMLARAEKYANAEEAVRARKDSSGNKQDRRGKRKRESPKRGRSLTREKVSSPPAERRRRSRTPTRRFENFTPLKMPRAQILMEIDGRGYLRAPNPMKTPVARRDKNKFCHFHRDYGHNTEDCFQLKNEIEALIRRGYLTRYVQAKAVQEEKQPDPPEIPENRPTAGVINVVMGGSLQNNARGVHPTEVQQGSKRPRTEEPITFTSEDLRGIQSPHDDAMVVSLTIAKYDVRRILVDNGSSANILFYETFLQMGIPHQELKEVSTPLVGFTGPPVAVEGTIDLLVTAGLEPRQSTKGLSFLVVKIPSPYNAILGRPGLNTLQAIVSTYHLLMRFPTKAGVGEVRGNQDMARQCYVTVQPKEAPTPLGRVEGPPSVPRPKGTPEGDSSPKISTPENQSLEESSTLEEREELDWRDELKQQRGRPAEGLEPISLSLKSPDRVVQIGSNLDKQARKGISDFLKANQDVFAWTAKDIQGVSPDVITHKLSVQPGYHPVRQKKRHFALERQRIIDQEVDKLLEAGFIREVDYPDWLANVVLVQKANGKWRVCIDYTDLNKACPKDSYPLPRIDQLVDATAGHQVLTFLDAFSGYNQIQMAPDDEEKTSFLTGKGLYCYKVMPFGLKNAGATYQRLVNKAFKHQIGRNMEVYVDDMLVKSKEAGHHITDLEEAFQTLRGFGIKLNPTKCAFGVSSGKFLGFLVTQRGIEANPEKIQAIQEMQPPRTVKEVQRLTGRVAALSRFLSKSAEHCAPFFKILRNPKGFLWTEECQTAFDRLKGYLRTPPLLSKPSPGEVLLLYLAVSPLAVSSVLLKEEEGRQRPVYYVSKVLRDAETRYPRLEKVAYALIISARKLRPYFQAHPVAVLTNQPIRQVLQRPECAGRLAKWAVELGEFDIEYRPRPSIKGQALADFVVECTIPPEEEHEDDTELIYRPWILHIDGASNRAGCGAGLILTSPDGLVTEYALRLEFPATNNEAEYEALLTGLKIAQDLDIKQLRVFSDSQLVVGQVCGEYEARETNMAKYLQKAKELSATLAKFEIQQIPRAENARADLLSKLASADTSKLPKEAYLQALQTPSIQEPSPIMCLAMEPSWMDPLLDYLKEGNLPEEKTQARRVKRQAARYLLIGDRLYRRSYTQPLLKCLRPSEAGQALKEVHEGLCGDHLGGRPLALKVMRQGFYWPTLMDDAATYVKKCDRCQRFSTIQRRPSVTLSPIFAPWPFAQWGMDILGPFPPAAGQRKFLFVAVDYFTKWVEAEPVAQITEVKTRNFVRKYIVCRFGVPRIIITDNGRQFDNDRFDEFCSNLGIQHRFTSVAHPQTNGEAEVTNRTILKGLKTRLDRAKALWVEELDNVLWGYRTTHRTATGETPFSLTYGTEAVIPVEITLSSPRVENFNITQNEETLRNNLDLLEEKRERARVHMMTYQQRVARYYNARVRGKLFRNGELVLRKVEASRADDLGKLGPNWEGPYQIAEVVRPGTYKLQRLDGTLVQRTWNSDHLRTYYQ